MTERRYFLLPWLLFHALVVVALVIVFIIVIVLGQPIEHRWWALVPLFFGLYLVYAWIKVKCFFQISKGAVSMGSMGFMNFINFERKVLEHICLMEN